jgi:hypothetical protein
MHLQFTQIVFTESYTPYCSTQCNHLQIKKMPIHMLIPGKHHSLPQNCDLPEMRLCCVGTVPISSKKINGMKKILLVATTLAFLNSNAQSLHGDLESWRTYHVSTVPDSTFQAPMYWNTPDSLTFLALSFYTTAIFTKQLTSTTDAHSGGLAARLVTKKEDTLGVFPGLMTNADIALNMAAFASGDMDNVLLLSGGTPVSSRIPFVNAWVKYYPTGTDTGFLRVEAIKSSASASGGDSVIGYGVEHITGVCSTYTQINADINYTDATSVPDLIRVYISSSGRAPQIGSELLVDDINITPASVADAPAANQYHTYPIPAGNYICFGSAVKGKFTVHVYTANGSVAGHYTALPGEKIDVSGLNSGLYIYSIVNNSEGLIGRGTFVLIK